MKRNDSERINSRIFTVTAMLIAAFFVFATIAATDAAAQLDKLKKVIKKAETEADKQTDRTRPANPSPTPPANNPATGGTVNAGQTGSGNRNAFQSKRLVFSSQPIDPGNPSNLKTSFQAGEHIYGLLILNVPFRDFIVEESTRDPNNGYNVTRPVVKIDFMVDREPLFSGSHKFVFSLEDKQNAWKNVPSEAYFFFDIAPEAARQKTYAYEDVFFPMLSAVGRKNNKAKAGAQLYAHELSKLKSGTHTITVKISGKEQVTGEFQISGSDFAMYSRVADELESVSSTNAKLPDSKWDNPSLANSVRTAYKRLGNETVLRVNLLNPDWFVQRNSLGQILFRGIFAAIATKTPDGKCYMQREYFKQNYGGGNYGATEHDGRSETRQLIPCENVAR